MTNTTATLARRLSLGDAIFIGLGSMVGAGVFVVWAPAAHAAASWLLVGLGIALVVAFCNATSSAQLAAQYPTSGGTYVYGRERLGRWPGFLAGWGFVVGKTASIAAMALTFGHYVFGPAAPWIAVGVVIVLAVINSLGVTRTAMVTRVIVAVVLVVLALVVVANLMGGPRAVSEAQSTGIAVGPNIYGMLQSAGLLFFAFAGYARIATMGEEVKNPTRTIPIAIPVALALAAIVYAAVGATLLFRFDAELIALSTAPLSFATINSPLAVLTPVVAAGAALATVGAMLNLMTGVGRTSLAMARNNDLPRWLAKIEPVHGVPRNAEIALALVVCALVLLTDVRVVIGFSSFGVLVYYLFANLAAFTQDREHRRYPKFMQILGAVLCVVLVVTLPLQAIAIGVGVYLVGIVYRLIRRPDRAPVGRRAAGYVEDQPTIALSRVAEEPSDERAAQTGTSEDRPSIAFTRPAPSEDRPTIAFSRPVSQPETVIDASVDGDDAAVEDAQLPDDQGAVDDDGRDGEDWDGPTPTRGIPIQPRAGGDTGGWAVADADPDVTGSRPRRAAD